MIEVKDLSFSYGQKKILDQVSFQLVRENLWRS